MTGAQAIPSDDATHQPLVTVLVPSYNGGKFLRQSLDSILAQTYANLEIILLDDASSDDTPEIAREYRARITYVRQPSNLGQFDNVNDGIARASGEFISVFHADDIYLPQIVEREVAYLGAHPEVGAVFASDIFIDAQSREYSRLKLRAEVRGECPLDYATVLNALLTHKNRFLVGPSAMVRAAVYRAVGTYRGARYQIASDLEMWMRIARRYPIAILEAHLMKYRHFHGNASETYEYLRTDPEAYFVVMDDYLADGDRGVATSKALLGHEAHRSEDRLMAAISHYIKGELPAGRAALSAVRIGAIAGNPHVQRGRLIVLTLGMWCLLRIPRREWFAQRMFNRWHVKRPPG